MAIIGAGIAGLVCAATLLRAGRSVTLFDKGRRPGGRIATRRVDGMSFDHGAQFATAHGTAFQSVMRRLSEAGAVASWPAAQRSERIAWVGVPGMSALPRALADELAALGASLLTDRHVGFVQPGAVRHWPAAEMKPGAVSAEGGELAQGFSTILLAIPAPQATPLLEAIGHDFAEHTSKAVIAPCWAVMLSFADPVAAPDCMRPPSGPLGWIARDSARPGHAATPDRWVLHATEAWSRAHLEAPAEQVIQALLAAFHLATGSTAEPLYRSAHRWRHALVERALGQSCLWDARSGIGLCGDWCLGPRVEAAHDSGVALAHAVLGA